MKKLLPLLLLILIGCSKNGFYEEYYPDGQILNKYNYKNNQLDGPFKTYHIDGEIKEEGSYSLGKKVSYIKYFYKKYDYVKDDIEGNCPYFLEQFIFKCYYKS